MNILLPVCCIAVLIAIAFACSENKKAVDWKLVAAGIVMQLIFAFLILKTEAGLTVFRWLGSIVDALLGFTNEGAKFVFGGLVSPNEAGLAAFGFIFAFNVLPTIIFFSSFMAILYHVGIMQKVIYVIAWVMQRTLKTSGAESLSASANIFVGQTEAPLVVKPYIDKMTRSEIMCVMTGGMATVAGGVMAGYVGMLHDKIDNIAGHLMAASVMAAPVSMVFSKILVPETGVPETSGKMEFKSESIDSSVIDACSRGCSEGMSLAINVAAMLIGFTAMIALINSIWGAIANFFGWTAIATLQDLLGYIFYPITFLLGIRPEDRVIAGGLIGEKTILNEFVAYSDLANKYCCANPVNPIDEKTKVILTYALCGFANFSSIGIQIAGIGGLAPRRRSEIAGMAIKALLAATLTCFFTSSIASIMFTPKAEEVKTATAVEQSLNSVVESVKSTAAQATEAVANTAAQATEAVANTAAQATEAVANTAAQATEAVANTAAQATEAVANTAAEATEAVADTAAQATEAVANTAAEVTEAVKTTAAEAAEAVKDAVTPAAQN